MAENYEVGLDQNRINQNRQMDWQEQKPWYRNEVFAGGVAAGINGISNYLMEQERLRGQRSLQSDRFAAEERTINSAVQRASTMPLLQRFTKPKKRG